MTTANGIVPSDEARAREVLVAQNADALPAYSRSETVYPESIVIRAMLAFANDRTPPVDREAIARAATWLRSISTWLLENDFDMKLPDGVLDTDPLDIADALDALTTPAPEGKPTESEYLGVEDEAEIAVAERNLIVRWLREQSDKGADIGLEAEKGTTRRAAYGGGSYALKRAADFIEADEHHALQGRTDATSMSEGVE